MAIRTLERDVQDTEDDSAGGTAGTRRGAASAAASGVRPGRRSGPCGAPVLSCSGDGHSLRGATLLPARRGGQRRWRHRHPVDGASIRATSWRWCYPHHGRLGATIDVVATTDQSNAWPFRLRPEEHCVRHAWCERVERGSPHPIATPRVIYGHPVRARQPTRSRWHLEDHAGGDAGGGRANEDGI